MIRIKRKGKAVQVLLTTDLPYDAKDCDTNGRTDYPFMFVFDDYSTAELFHRYLFSRLAERIRQAHEDAYEQGYQDGKRKKKKKTRFIGHLNGDRDPCW